MADRKLPRPDVVSGLFRSGSSLAEIGRRYGATRSSVAAYVARHGIDRVRECARCGSLFEAQNLHTTLCSSECRRAARARSDRASVEYAKLPTQCVYAIYFRGPGVLKVGLAAYRSYLAVNRAKARERFGAADGEPVWLRAGDHRHEAFVQAHMAFRYPQPDFGGRRICEWFNVGAAVPAALASELDEILAMSPEDRVARDPLVN